MSGDHPQRFPRSRRLCDKDFAAVVTAGKKSRAQGVVVLLKPTGVAGARFGMIVPKRFVPRAVDRNRSKRILREWFRLNRMRLDDKDCVVRITAPLNGKVNRNALIGKIERLLSDNSPQGL